jgi:uncharacterized membrane protein YraQ (UPF0718 family)
MVQQVVQEAAQIVEFVAQAAWRILPVFLLAVFLGVMVRALRLDSAIRGAFDTRVGLSILLATAVGAFTPFCSCTVVPIVAGLLVAGVPLAPVMSFWIASPTMDPEVFALSVGLIGWPLAVARLLATLLLSLGAGYLTLMLTRSDLLRGNVLRPSAVEEYGEEGVQETDGRCDAATRKEARQPALVGAGGPTEVPQNSGEGAACGCSGCYDGFSRQTRRKPSKTLRAQDEKWWTSALESLRQLSWAKVGRNMAKQSWKLGRWLLLALVVEAVIVLYVPQEAIAGVLGEDNAFAVPLAALVGIPLYLNELGALPIVSGLLEEGMQPGAAIAFLIAGGVTSIPAMVAVWSITRPRVFALYVSIGIFGATLLGLLTNLLL